MMIYTSLMMDPELKEHRSARFVSGKIQMFIGFQILSIKTNFDGNVEFTYLANPNREIVEVDLRLYRTGEQVEPGFTYLGQTEAVNGTKYIFGKTED